MLRVPFGGLSHPDERVDIGNYRACVLGLNISVMTGCIQLPMQVNLLID